MGGYQFDLSDFSLDCRFVICGAGKVGKDYYKQFNAQGYNVILWIDDDISKQIKDSRIKPKAEIQNVQFDYVIIAVMPGNIVGDMINQLLVLGVEASKIIWKRPLKLDYGFVYGDPFLSKIYQWRIEQFGKRKEPIESLQLDMETLKAGYEKILDLGFMEVREWYLNEGGEVAYLHNAKVACTSLKASLKNVPYMENYSYVHLSMEKEKVDKLDEVKCYKYTFVRNPFSRLVSCYKSKYLSDRKIFGDFNANLCYGRKRYLLGWLEDVKDFKEFADKICQIPVCWQERHFRSQYDLIYENDVCLVDYVGKFEQLRESYVHIQRKYGLQDLLHYNKTDTQDWENYYDYETAVKVFKKYEKDIIVFGYEEECKQLLERLRA